MNKAVLCIAPRRRRRGTCTDAAAYSGPASQSREKKERKHSGVRRIQRSSMLLDKAPSMPPMMSPAFLGRKPGHARRHHSPRTRATGKIRLRNCRAARTGDRFLSPTKPHQPSGAGQGGLHPSSREKKLDPDNDCLRQGIGQCHGHSGRPITAFPKKSRPAHQPGSAISTRRLRRRRPIGPETLGRATQF